MALGEEPLPAPWILIDGDDGPFYYNEESGESQWEPPGEVPEDAAENAADDRKKQNPEDDQPMDENHESQQEEEVPVDVVAQPEVICREVRQVEGQVDRVVAAIPMDPVLKIIPDGTQALLTCAPGILFRIKGIRGPNAREGETEDTEEEFVFDLKAIDCEWQGLAGTEENVALTVLLSGGDIEEAFFSAMNSLMDDKRKEGGLESDQKAMSWNCVEVLTRAQDLFPEVVGGLAEDDIESVLAGCSFFEASICETSGAIMVGCKVHASPLEDSALRAFTVLSQQQHLFQPLSSERPWKLVADELARSIGDRNEDLDRRFLEASPHFSFTYSEVRGHHVIRLRNPPAEFDKGKAPEKKRLRSPPPRPPTLTEARPSWGSKAPASRTHPGRSERDAPDKSSRSSAAYFQGKARTDEGGRKDDRRREDYRREDPRKDDQRPNNHRKDEYRRDEPRREEPRRESSRRDEPRRDERGPDYRKDEYSRDDRPSLYPRDTTRSSDFRDHASSTRSRDANSRTAFGDSRGSRDPGRGARDGAVEDSSRAPYSSGARHADRDHYDSRRSQGERPRSRSRSRRGGDRRRRSRSPPKASIEDRLAALLHTGSSSGQSQKSTPAGVWASPSQPPTVAPPPAGRPGMGPPPRAGPRPPAGPAPVWARPSAAVANGAALPVGKALARPTVANVFAPASNAKRTLVPKAAPKIAGKPLVKTMLRWPAAG